MLDGGTLLSSRYRLGELIARGGMGDVHVAEDLDRGDRVCVKVLRGTDPRDLQRFASESRLLDRLDHPLIVALLDSGAHGQVPYLVMEYIDGPSLRELMRDGPLDQEVVRRVGRDVAQALTHAHAAGIIHRDIKPANVLIDREGNAHLADFGIARLADVTGLTATGTAIGTAAYLAPEQLLTSVDVGPATDVYSLGLMLLEALTAESAFEGTATEAAFARLYRDPPIPEHLSPPWRSLLAAMTAREPAHRPSTQDVAEALRPGGPFPELILGWEATEELPSAETVVLDRGVAGEAAADTRSDGEETPSGHAVPGSAVGHASERRPRMLTGAVLVSAVALAAVLALISSRPVERTDGDGPTAEGSTSSLPVELERALRDLEEEVGG